MAELLFQSKQEKLADGSPIIITKILGAIDGTTVRQFEDKLIGFFNQGVKNLILIFSDVKYINSTGMGLLVKLADKFQEGGGDIKLVGVPEKVIALFDMLGLLSLFKIYETEEDAIESISNTDSKPEAKPSAPPAPPVTAAVPAKSDTRPIQAKSTSVAPVKAAPVPVPPAPKPQPVQPVQAPQEEVGNVFVIDGGDDLGETSPTVPVNWPYSAACGACGGTIEFATKGNHKCVRCSSYISIDEYGKQSVKAAMSSHMVEVRYPCHSSFISASKATVNGLAQVVGFSNTFNDEINEALDNALSIAIEKSNKNPKESFQILAVADGAEMIVGVKSLYPFLVQGGPKDPRLPSIARKVDRLEVFPLPTQGQLLKMTKKRK